MKISISTRLALYYGLSLLLILCAFVVYLYSSFHIGLHQEFREQLQRDELHLRKAIQITDGAPQFYPEKAQSLASFGLSGEGSAVVRLLTLGGNTLYHSPALEGRRLFAPQIPTESQQTFLSASWQGRPTQSLYAPLSSEFGAVAGWLEITRFESGMHRELHRLRWLLTVGILLGAVVAIGFGHWMAGRSLKPIAALTQAANDIQAESSKKRLPERFGVRDELTDLAETLNNLLGRLDASLERERRFRADAAHQMFTPLTTIQGEVEIALRKPRSSAEYQSSLKRVCRQSESLINIVEGLLQLSSAESFALKAGEKIDAGACIVSKMGDFEALAEKRKISLRHNIQPGLYAKLHAEHFFTVIDNLIENALKYTPCDGTITVSAYKQKHFVSIDIEDTGIGLTGEEMHHIFDRFYRSEREEINQVGGIGLGLSIVQAIVQAYGGEISVDSKGEGGGSIFSVRFPLC